MVALTTAGIRAIAFGSRLLTRGACSRGCQCTEHQGISQTPSWPRL